MATDRSQHGTFVDSSSGSRPVEQWTVQFIWQGIYDPTTLVNKALPKRGVIEQLANIGINKRKENIQMTEFSAEN